MEYLIHKWKVGKIWNFWTIKANPIFGQMDNKLMQPVSSLEYIAELPIFFTNSVCSLSNPVIGSWC